MVTRHPVLSLFAPLLVAYSVATAERGWHFVQNGTSGIAAMESVIVSDTLAIFFDQALSDPLRVDGHSAWGAVWNQETNTASPIKLITDSFCGSGGFLGNGTMVSVGGHVKNIPEAGDGRMGIRIWEPCGGLDGVGCAVFEEPPTLHLVETRWHPSTARIFDGSLMIVGGMRTFTEFYNTKPVNNIEFFPPKDGGVPRPLDLLARTLPANIFPRTIALPDGRIFIAANNQTIIYDIETNTEIKLPDIPNGIRVTNPLDGPRCGRSNTNDLIPFNQLSSQDPASDQCSRMILTPDGIKCGWEIERMLERRVLSEIVLAPNGQVLIINGAKTGYAASHSTVDPVGNFLNYDHPALTPSLYTPKAPPGKRISNEGMPKTSIARVYHSTVTLTPKGSFLIAGSNPNDGIVNGTEYHSEFRVEYLNPPYMTMERPRLSNVPKQIVFSSNFQADIFIPSNLKKGTLKAALMDLGFSTHAFHSSSRLVFMNAQLSEGGKKLNILSPPNTRVYPPGPAYLFVNIDDVTSPGVRVLMGNGLPPPVEDQ